MSWQDVVIAIAQICFVFALVPTLRSKTNKPEATTCVINVILIYIISFCLLSLELWLSAATAICVGTAWLVLAVQKVKIDKRHKR